MGTYPQFQNGLEGGAGITSFHQMHNALHGWIGGHMSSPTASPFDPLFYLHHCNIDRLWAMWQADGHADEYPLNGGTLHHHRNDLMYPWTGGAAGYGTNAAIAANIPMPDYAALGGQTNGSTLDFRAQYGYTYDTIAVMGIGLDRTGSMLQLTPDPMVVAAPDVTKWEAAKRGVSAFLQDCETVQQSGATYVIAGVQTFRRIGPGNDFANVLPAPGYGLVKPGGTHGRAAFDGAIAPLAPGGSTPLADALVSVRNTLVSPPFGGVPADERRYLAMLTDGVRTSGALMSSIPDGSFTNVAVFGLGFGTGADVDYATIAGLVAKGGVTLPTTQVFHGENAGTIDKFYSTAGGGHRLHDGHRSGARALRRRACAPRLPRHLGRGRVLHHRPGHGLHDATGRSPCTRRTARWSTATPGTPTTARAAVTTAATPMSRRRAPTRGSA